MNNQHFEQKTRKSFFFQRLHPDQFQIDDQNIDLIASINIPQSLYSPITLPGSLFHYGITGTPTRLVVLEML